MTWLVRPWSGGERLAAKDFCARQVLHEAHVVEAGHASLTVKTRFWAIQHGGAQTPVERPLSSKKRPFSTFMLVGGMNCPNPGNAPTGY